MSDVKTLDLASAERLAGLEFDPGEREMAVRGVSFHQRMYARTREVELPNGLGPATGFDPRLPGQAFATQQAPLARSDADPLPVATPRGLVVL